MKNAVLKRLPELSFYQKEAINQLRINIGLCGQDVKTIMVTSSVPNEGKSFVSMNLWRSIAAAGNKVLLLDLDLRNSNFRSKYGITVDGDLASVADLLAGRADVDEAMLTTNVPNGYMIVMSASVPNPAFLLENGALKSLLEQFREMFDYIILDTPPVNTVADALNIASLCDGTVVVVRGGITPRKMAQHTVFQLQRTGIPILGTVLNRISTTGRASAYYNRSYGYYGYYGYGRYGRYGHYGKYGKRYGYGYGYGYGYNTDKKKENKK